MNNWMAYYNGIFQEKITSQAMLSKIQEWLLSVEGNIKDTIVTGIDTIYFYVTPSQGYLVEFSNGCIKAYTSLNLDAVNELTYAVLPLNI